MIRIIHISDFHLENENPSYEKKELVKSLTKDLKAYVNESTIFVFTGDLIDKGGKNFTNQWQGKINFW